MGINVRSSAGAKSGSGSGSETMLVMEGKRNYWGAGELGNMLGDKRWAEAV